MAEESPGAARLCGSGWRWNAIKEKTRVQRIKNMALSGIQGKPMGPFASNVPIQAMHELYRWTVGGEDESGSTGFRHAFRR